MDTRVYAVGSSPCLSQSCLQFEKLFDRKQCDIHRSSSGRRHFSHELRSEKEQFYVHRKLQKKREESGWAWTNIVSRKTKFRLIENCCAKVIPIANRCPLLAWPSHILLIVHRGPAAVVWKASLVCCWAGHEKLNILVTE